MRMLLLLRLIKRLLLRLQHSCASHCDLLSTQRASKVFFACLDSIKGIKNVKGFREQARYFLHV
jgi:hypothetical protein